jgi:hypothetical protein
MRFSWTGVLVAPLFAPMLLSAAVVSLFDTKSRLFEFLFLLIVGYVISFGTTIVLLLPCLFLLSRWRPMTGVAVCLLGLALGLAVFVPLTWFVWRTSGADSGPPTESFFGFFVRWFADPMTLVYPLAGLLTAGLYWGFGTWRLRGAGRDRGDERKQASQQKD